MILFVLGEPLDFEPGTKHAYSNLGYVLLGRVIEAVTGER
jgi:N-acyl-D-amino-acid deacylase